MSSPSRRKKGSSPRAKKPSSPSSDYHSELAVLAAVGLTSDHHAEMDNNAFCGGSSDMHNINSISLDDDDSSSSSEDDSVPNGPPVAARYGENSTQDDRSMSMLLDPVQQVTALNYVAEHRIFLKAILELLSQRDTYKGIEVDINDPNTIKCGPLKKASHRIRGAWKVFYVEIRRGLLSYYEDTASKDSLNEERLTRKNVALQANVTTCRPVKVQGLTGGAVFELAIEGRPKKLWMASSKKERQAWLTAIQNAMVGGSVVRGDSQTHHVGRRSSIISPTSPYQKDLHSYLGVQGAITRATSKQDYIGALKGVVGASLNVPVQWIRERTEKSTPETFEKTFLEEDTSVGVRQIWKDLLRDSVCINGELFRGDCGHGPERIVGALTRSIMMLDKSFADQSHSYSSSKSVTESQALSYARDVLLAGNRTRSGGDSYFCVDTLCKNPDLAVLCPSTTEAEPLAITVEPTGGTEYSTQDDSGWLKSRSRPQKPWKKRYFVLSEGTLSFYEKAQPRPHGLRGQLVLANATLQISQEQAVSKDGKRRVTRLVVGIVMKDGAKGRQLCFDDQNKFFLWTSALEDAIRRNAGRSSLTQSVVGKMRRGLRDEIEGMPKDAGEGGIASLKEYAAAHGLDEETLDRRVELLRQKSGKFKSSVNISVRASTEYKICTTDPQGDEGDTWAWIRASFLQNFCVSGGPNGRMKRGEEIVQICIQDHPLDR